MTKPSIEAAKHIEIPDAALPYLSWMRLSWMRHEQMTCRQVAIYMLVEANNGCGVGALAHALDIPKPSVTRAVQKLLAMGLLTMRTDPNDYRMVKIYVAENAK